MRGIQFGQVRQGAEYTQAAVLVVAASVLERELAQRCQLKALDAGYGSSIIKAIRGVRHEGGLRE